MLVTCVVLWLFLLFWALRNSDRLFAPVRLAGIDVSPVAQSRSLPLEPAPAPTPQPELAAEQQAEQQAEPAPEPAREPAQGPVAELQPEPRPTSAPELQESEPLPEPLPESRTLPETGSLPELPPAARADARSAARAAALAEPLTNVPLTAAQVEAVERMQPSPTVEVRSEPEAGVAEPVDTPAAKSRRDEISNVVASASSVRFDAGEAALSAATLEWLDSLYGIMFLYPDITIEFVIEGNEFNRAARDRSVATQRGVAMLDNLDSRGIERNRVSLDIGSGRGLLSGTHRVRVRVDDPTS